MGTWTEGASHLKRAGHRPRLPLPSLTVPLDVVTLPSRGRPSPPMSFGMGSRLPFLRSRSATECADRMTQPTHADHDGVHPGLTIGSGRLRHGPIWGYTDRGSSVLAG